MSSTQRCKGAESAKVLTHGHSADSAAAQKPSIGRMVHFVREIDRSHKPAVIITVWRKGQINLVVFDELGGEAGSYIAIKAGLDPTGRKIGSWHWPERK